MDKLVRTFCLTLVVALMASMMVHAPSEARDQAEHMADQIAELHGVDIQGHMHPDCSEKTSEPTQGHHHHSGSDSHSAAVPERSALVLAVAGARATLRWPNDAMLSGLPSPGPDQPPKRTLTVI
ncbi:MAG: hypothetical protein QE280_05395 [Caulobacter sp.]|nr:hypothetical protein [Caulobacter sp.]